MSLIGKFVIYLLTHPEIFTAVETTASEILSHDPRSEKVANIAANISHLTMALTHSNAIANGANGDK